MCARSRIVRYAGIALSCRQSTVDLREVEVPVAAAVAPVESTVEALQSLGMLESVAATAITARTQVALLVASALESVEQRARLQCRGRAHSNRLLQSLSISSLCWTKVMSFAVHSTRKFRFVHSFFFFLSFFFRSFVVTTSLQRFRDGRKLSPDERKRERLVILNLPLPHVTLDVRVR